MENREIIKKVFLTDSNYTILDVNNPNILNDIEIEDFRLDDGMVLNVKDFTYKSLYNDLEHPLVMEKSYSNKYIIHINPEYYLYNQEKIDEIICNYIKKYKEENFELSNKVFIKDKMIDEILNNKNIKVVEFAKYSKDGYILTVEHYKKFKEAGVKIDSKNVCDELKDNYDEIIVYNMNKNLISYNKYRNLKNSKGIYLDRELTNDELDNLKYINDELVISLEIENYEHLIILGNRLKELGKNNLISIKLDEKERFNKFVFEKDLSEFNIFVETPELDKVSLKDYLRFEKILYVMVQNTKDLSPFEKYIYAYNITKQFKDYKESKDLNESRRLYSLLVNEYMVCVGFSRLFGNLLSKMGIENSNMSVDIDASYDNASAMQTEFRDNVATVKNGHARRYVHLVDPKYGIDGYYIADPTWDNDLEYDYYNYMVLTDNEITHNKRYTFVNYLDILNVNNMEEYIDKMKRLRNQGHYESFIFDMKRIVDFIKKIDSDLYNDLKVKYEFIDKTGDKWPDNITEFIYDLGEAILKKVNKTVSGDVIFKGVKEVYRHSYGYKEEDLSEILERVRKDNIKRQYNDFPKRYIINQDGSTETLYEENKFIKR